METSVELCVRIAERLISNLAFPIFVAVWTLIFQRRSMDRLTRAINSLTKAFERANIHTTNQKEGGEI